MTHTLAQEICSFVHPNGRLPSEVEWELAAGNGLDKLYPWGDDSPSCAEMHANFWDVGFNAFIGCGQLGTQPVGLALAGRSPIGALDMIGNVYEWTADCWHSTYTGAPR